ncbi:hypothetical protein [Leucobacter luti]|uniref:hypothetical protein n=1 Tax=Leucobacter luti TaxID=340320 RepID=UPI001C689B08|nr:hypothetical protein [Leucobacter luti]QYM74726.1 hypothetical protein K1X41_08150 [Leucobacter luti]
MTYTTQFRRSVLLALPVAALLLSGCTAAGGGTDSAANKSEQQTDQTAEAWHVKYAGCMQDEGLDYPEPDPNANGMVAAIDIEALGGMDAFSAADKTCRGKIGDPPQPTGEDGKPISDEQMRKDSLEVTECLREQGIDVEDPGTTGGITIDESMSTEALEACGLSGMATSVAE